VKPAFVLCDPALLMPPPDDVEAAVRFWTRLVEWSADRRLRLGPLAYEVVLGLLGKGGWPDAGTIPYPPGLGKLAARALSTILQQVLPAGDGDEPEKTPILDPNYRLDAAAALAIAHDAVRYYDHGLVGLATDTAHWDREADELRFEPPPPESIALLFTPNRRLPQERERAVTRYLRDRRITIVGGEPSPHIVAALSERFAIPQRKIRWVGCNPGERLNLDSLDGLQASVDVVYCVTGHIGHAGSTKARKRCRKRGTQLREVEHANDIAEDLVKRHGGVCAG
jgi:hypothetical protein